MVLVAHLQPVRSPLWNCFIIFFLEILKILILLCTCYKMHVLQSARVAKYTCCKVHMLQTSHVAKCMCYKVHMLQSAQISKCTCYKVHVLQSAKNKVTSYLHYILHFPTYRVHLIYCINKLLTINFYK